MKARIIIEKQDNSVTVLYCDIFKQIGKLTCGRQNLRKVTIQPIAAKLYATRQTKRKTK